LRLSIGTDGDVTGAEITGSSGSATLDAAAVRHVRRRWKFRPAQRGETAVLSTVPAVVNWKRN
jgi:protein TonB